MNLLTSAKAAVALGLAALTALGTAIADGHITGDEWVGIALAVLTAAGVWLVPNAPTKDVAPPR